MLKTLLHAKLHGARVTDHNLDYQGSIAIDRALMDAVGILPHELVHVANKATGARFETYVIEAPAGSGSVCVNGAASRLVDRGDELLIMAYGVFTEAEARGHRPKVALLSPDNRVVELAG